MDQIPSPEWVGVTAEPRLNVYNPYEIRDQEPLVNEIQEYMARTQGGQGQNCTVDAYRTVNTHVQGLPSQLSICLIPPLGLLPIPLPYLRTQLRRWKRPVTFCRVVLKVGQCSF